MRKFTLLLILSCAGHLLNAQWKAVTENGDEVLLNENGTWKYVNEREEGPVIAVNDRRFTKSKSASFLLKSSRHNTGFWLDPKKWSFTKAKNNEDAEYELQLKDGDLYAMIISEKVEIPLETLRTIALSNCTASAPDAWIVNEEYRTVNDLQVLMMQINGTMEGIKFVYYGYYYSNSSGTVQFVTYTAQNLIESYRSECEELLNGLVEQR